MSTKAPVEIMPPEKPFPHGEGPQPLPRRVLREKAGICFCHSRAGSMGSHFF